MNLVQLEKEIKQAINFNSAEEWGGNTPDFVLADFMLKAMRLFGNTAEKRDEWHSKQKKDKGLGFATLREANVARNEKVFHKVDEWTPTDWATAMAGECGEACNLIKKLRRGEAIESSEIGKELADLVIYADLLAARLGIDLGEAVRAKFNQVSDQRGTTIRL